MPELYPHEIAVPMDRDLQFFSLIVEPVNRFLLAMNMSSLDTNLKRSVEVVVAKSKKPLTDDQIYPLYTVDQASLGYTEVPQKFWKIIGNPDIDVPEEDFAEYLSVITKYGLNTTIVPKIELEKYLKRLAKKRAEPEVISDELVED
jgi:hypothetical protein